MTSLQWHGMLLPSSGGTPRMLPTDPAVWALANEMRDLVRPEEAYACAEKHLTDAYYEGFRDAYEHGVENGRMVGYWDGYDKGLEDACKPGLPEDRAK